MADRSIVETEFYLSDGGDTGIRNNRAQLVRQGVDRGILAVLDTKFRIGYRTYTVLDAAGETFHSISTNQPGLVVIQALQGALARRQLSLDSKRTLFAILKWQFECHACHVRKPAAEYDGTSYILWGEVDPPQPHLRSGPCEECRDAARKSNNRQSALVVYRVNGL